MINQARFANLWQRLGGQGDASELFASLLAAYAEPPRAYHNVAHLQDCLAQFDAARDEVQHSDEVEMALWFHDAVYDPRATDNEEKSAAWAIQALTSGCVAQATTARIAELVLSTQHKVVPVGQDATLLVDIDLSILGRAPAVFDAYDRQIRSEYKWVPEQQYCTRRAQVLAGFLARPRLYQTEYFYTQYEKQARENLVRAIDRLTTSIH